MWLLLFPSGANYESETDFLAEFQNLIILSKTGSSPLFEKHLVGWKNFAAIFVRSFLFAIQDAHSHLNRFVCPWQGHGQP